MRYWAGRAGTQKRWRNGCFAEHRQPQALIEMREVYYEFTNDDRYLETAEMSGVVTSALRDAWDGVGPWPK